MRSGFAARTRAATRSSAMSQDTRWKPGSPRRRSIGYARRPRPRSSAPLRLRSAATSASASGSIARIVLSDRSERRVVQRWMPSIVQSRKPLTPSAQPSHTPRERIRQA